MQQFFCNLYVVWLIHTVCSYRNTVHMQFDRTLIACNCELVVRMVLYWRYHSMGNALSCKKDGWVNCRPQTIQQGVVTFMSHVEALATGIKMNSSDQCPFYEQFIKGRAELINDTQEVWLPFVKVAIKSFGRKWSNDHAQFSSIKKPFDPIIMQTLQQATYKWLSLVQIREMR